MYVIYQMQITEAKYAIDGKRHKHKRYLYPIPDTLHDLNVRRQSRGGLTPPF